jgi:hypothetical protein
MVNIRSISAKNQLASILSRFQVEEKCPEIIPITSGHIHRSYHVLPGRSSGHQYILQRINHHVFQNVPFLMENLVRIIAHLRMKQSSERDYHTPVLIQSHEGAFTRDSEGNFWRLFQFIPESHILDQVRTPDEAGAVGRAFSQFVRLMADFPEPPLHETIPDFHGFRNRLELYLDVLRRDPCGRISQVQSEISWIDRVLPLMTEWESLVESTKLPSRITHNDTKWNNVLFDVKQRAICVIDLDTVMEGLIAYDFGDGIRTACNKGKEDEPNLDCVGLDMARFEGFTRGYLSAMRTVLTEAERDTLIFAAQRMTFIIGFRFFTDFLNGDIYYQIGRKDHNLIRARAQFQFFKDLQIHSAQIEDIILTLWGKTGK